MSETARRRGQDLTGRRFGLLVVEDRAGYVPNSGAARWLCRCDCGESCTAESTRLLSGRKATCGCRGAGFKKHGHTTAGNTSPTHRTWDSMRSRCTNKSSGSYKHYGARGITVCERWQVFANFLADMGERPDGHTLDRKNNDLGYTPENCRWATPHQQAQNQRKTKIDDALALEIVRRARDGESNASISRSLGVPVRTVFDVKTGRSWTTVTGLRAHQYKTPEGEPSMHKASPIAPARCPECDWTNHSLLNYGEPGSPMWMCHGCASRTIRTIRHHAAQAKRDAT